MEDVVVWIWPQWPVEKQRPRAAVIKMVVVDNRGSWTAVTRRRLDTARRGQLEMKDLARAT